ncbi:prepilin-type N-terminal cleavage/methylation domain-containing protein [Candidatus Berkiella aquae]|uniref:Prepilin-type N-terminal cleavage/methylation domain-containing protein n=1 Tax=Candidatus Berkiella aquae TaxID=295108 RepID=A0A0Q9YYQ5_9GAMM|nr:prepilin-type N-terminal cleavage/methylation domain-containing protein [Candidatus Berkiella aquae]MCS5712665.1 prepilin-type N-terminal cleavage/methylation domain-containing protein [Candidatus Berkiella aquae]
MKKQTGFTLIELVITMVISAILASVVIEIIAGPIRSYFWYAKRSALVNIAESNFDTIQQDLHNSLSQSVVIQNNEHSQNLSFRKILYKGIMLPNQTLVLPEHINLANQNEPLFIVFPNSAEKEKLHPFSLRNDKDKMSENILHPVPYYIVGSLMQYRCKQNEHQLERILELNDNLQEKSLMTNQISDCQFSQLTDGSRRGVLISLTFGQEKEQVKLTQPIYVEQLL